LKSIGKVNNKAKYEILNGKFGIILTK